MMWRLADVPAYSTYTSAVEAPLYNTIRRAVLHSTQPIRIPIAGLSHIEMIIDEDSWVCVDTTNNDFPIVSWVTFETSKRYALSAPVQCEKNYYHYAAGKVAASALKTAKKYLTEMYSPAPVCTLASNKPKKTWKTGTKAVLSCV